jgi:5-formyltetrahydrofolate cyclo-ligase
MAFTNLKLDKVAVRKMMSQRRNDLNAEKIIELSRKIEGNLFFCEDFLSRQHILYYLSFGKEVSTDAMIVRSLLLHKKVYVPRIKKNGKEMEICEIKSLETDFELNNFGIREPSGTCVHIVSPNKIDVVVTPGLAFDCSGGRIGSGGGYFDKLFEDLPDNSLSIGIAYSFQILDSLHQDSWDKKVQKVITEKGMLKG